MSDDKSIEVEGKIITVLPGTMFKVELLKSPGHIVLAHISGKLRKNFIKIAAGDSVKMEMSPTTLKRRVSLSACAIPTPRRRAWALRPAAGIKNAGISVAAVA